jgi:hypothetical protein
MRAGTESADADAHAGAPVAGAHACRNCGAHAPGNYCPNCGQETLLTLPTFATFMREAAGRYVALDGRAWRTLYALVARPGFLTLEYFAGRRRRYIRPARLFLVLYLVLFAIIGFVQSPADLGNEVVFVSSGTDGDAAAAPDGTGDDAKGKDAIGAAQRNARAAARDAVAKNPPAAETAATSGPPAAAGGRSPSGTVDGDEDTLIGLDRDLNLILRLSGADLPMPDAVRKRYDHFKRLPRAEKAERLYAGALRYGPYAMVALLPAFALLQMLAYLGSGGRYPGRPRRYAEHLVYGAHLHSFAALAIMVLMLLPTGLPRALLGAWVVYYVIRARQVVYRGRWWAGLLRSSIIASVYLVLVALAIAGLLVVAVMLS